MNAGTHRGMHHLSLATALRIDAPYQPEGIGQQSDQSDPPMPPRANAMHESTPEVESVLPADTALAQSSAHYKSLLALADSPRQGDLDGRGALTEKGLMQFCDYMLDTALDQVTYTSALLDLPRLRLRIDAYVQARNDFRVPLTCSRTRIIAHRRLEHARDGELRARRERALLDGSAGENRDIRTAGGSECHRDLKVKPDNTGARHHIAVEGAEHRNPTGEILLQQQHEHLAALLDERGEIAIGHGPCAVIGPFSESRSGQQ